MTIHEQLSVSDMPTGQREQLAAILRQRLSAKSSTDVEPDVEKAPQADCDVAILGGGAAGLTLALQLQQARSGIRIVVVEKQTYPVPETTHKVGESTVEIAAHYLRDRLGLGDHLETKQLRKFGLRMFFTNNGNSDVAHRAELGSSVFPPLATYQLDRGRLENELVERCTAAGIEIRTGCKIQSVDLADPASAAPHRLTWSAGSGADSDISARWVIDASGRHRLLQRQLGLGKAVGHTANAAWLRLAHPLDITSWTDDESWHRRITEGDRALSTNHLMGPGYWVWLIRLASGSISIGIVADDDTHPFETFNTVDRALDWLHEHEPQCAKAIVEHRDDIQDFRVMKDYAYSAERVFSGAGRWCLTGEAGVFLDPLYSPGLDLIAIGNGLVTDLVTRSLDGEDVAQPGEVHDALFRRITEIWLAIYERQYGLMGHSQVMATKVIWDTAFYWGVFGLLFFNDMYRQVSQYGSVATNLTQLGELSNRVQAFFREWAELLERSGRPEGDTAFIDLYAPLNFMVQLHSGMADELTEAEFEERFADNTQLLRQLAGQLVDAVVDAYSDQSDAAVIEAIQRWQCDPLLGELLATYRRRRERYPTSDGWLTVKTSVAATTQASNRRTQ